MYLKIPHLKDIIISELQENDTELIDFIIKRLSDTWMEPKDTIEQSYVRPALNNAGFPYIFIARYKDIFVGKIMVAIEPDFLNVKNQPWIFGLFVEESYRNNGIGALLVEIAKKTAREHGYEELHLDTSDAAGYYEKLGGWQRIGIEPWEEANKKLVIMKTAL